MNERIHELWLLLQKAKRHRQVQHRLTQGHVDFLMQTAGSRRLNEWHKSLRMLRKDEKEVAVMLGGDPSQSMYSVLSTWGQFPYTLPPSTAGNLWREFMTAYRRKRRPLTHNPVSLIGKDPYIVVTRLERGEF